MSSQLHSLQNTPSYYLDSQKYLCVCQHELEVLQHILMEGSYKESSSQEVWPDEPHPQVRDVGILRSVAEPV